MEFALLGFLTGLSLILAIGAQNIFVIEQGLKKQHVFLVCLVCSVSDFILIFSGIFLFHYFAQYFNLILSFSGNSQNTSKFNIFLKTLGFTYLNPHVYSDTVFFLGNFSKTFVLNQKILFGFGATLASFLFFFSVGYLSKYLSQYAQSPKVWKIINVFIITFMSLLTIFVLMETVN